MATTPDHGYELIVDGDTSWGADYRTMVSDIDLRLPYATAQMFAVANTSATTISLANTWYRANVTTTAGLLSEGFTHTANRLTYATSAASDRRVIVMGTFDLLGPNNTVVQVGLGLGGSDPSTAAVTTIKIPNTGEIFGSGVGLLDLGDGDYMEIYVRIPSGTGSLTVQNLSVVVFG